MRDTKLAPFEVAWLSMEADIYKGIGQIDIDAIVDRLINEKIREAWWSQPYLTTRSRRLLLLL